jgi:hypothetical protein
MNLLKHLAMQYNTDKYLHKGYCETYNELFKDLREREITLLEIGVDKGGSLLMWADYFPNGKILGIDIDKNCFNESFPRIEVFIGDQKDEYFLNALNTNYDIIIDDGSHFQQDQQLSFNYLFRKLNYGGFYVIEDSFTSYWQQYQNEGWQPTVERFKEICDMVNFKDRNYPDIYETEITEQTEWFQYLEDNVKYIRFERGLIIIYKEAKNESI